MTDTTPAIERAAKANYLQRAGWREDAVEVWEQVVVPHPDSLRSWADATRPVVAAALDVEEVAQVLASAVGHTLSDPDRAIICTTCTMHRRQAEALRAAILGGAV